MWFLRDHRLHPGMDGGSSHNQLGVETEESGNVAVEVVRQEVVVEELVGIASHRSGLQRHDPETTHTAV